MGSVKSDGQYNYDAQIKANESNEKIAAENLEYQREQLAETQKMNEYQMAKDEKIMQREDTAIQRQVADARNAGISPLASGMVGQAGSSGSAGNNLLQTSALHNDYHAEPASKAGDYAMKFNALISMSDALNKLGQNLNNTWNISGQNALRQAQMVNMKDEHNWRKVTEPISLRQLQLQNTKDENYLYDTGKERAYNEKYGLNRGMTDYERLIRIFLNGRGTSSINGNLSALGLSDSVNYSVPSNITLDDFKGLFSTSKGSPAMDAIGGMQKELIDKAIDETKDAVSGLIKDSEVGKKVKDFKERVDSWNQYWDNYKDTLKKGYNRVKNFFNPQHGM